MTLAYLLFGLDSTLIFWLCLFQHALAWALFLFVAALPYFLVIQDAPGSPHVFPAPVAEGVISPRIATSFCWIIVSETKLRAPGVLTASGPCQLTCGNTSGHAC